MALTTNLLAYYKYDDGSGATVTDSLATFNGTWHGTGGHWTTGKINGGGLFNGSDDYVDLGSALTFNSTNAISIAAWVNITTFADYRAIAYTNGQNLWSLQTLTAGDTGAGFVRFGVMGGFLNSLNAISLSTWTHLAGTFDGSNYAIYINGQLNNSMTSAKTINDTGVSKYMGSLNGTQQMFTGSMDEVGFWNRALTQTEVSSLNNGGSGLQYPFSSTGSPSNGIAYANLLFKL